MRGPFLGFYNPKPISLKIFLDFLETLTMCLKQGLSLIEAIDLIKTLKIIKKEPLDRFRAQLQEHAHLSQALNTLLAKSLRMPSFSKRNLPESKRFLEDVYAFYKQYYDTKKPSQKRVFIYSFIYAAFPVSFLNLVSYDIVL